jgi:NADH:ubiquinone oxidoreductase subunit E
MDKSSIISQFEPKQHNMLNILHELQNNNPQNYLTNDDLKLVAEYLNTTQSSVFGVVKYYSMFSIKPRGKYVIRVCKSPLCQMLGVDSILDIIKENLGIGLGELSNDLLFSVEAAECLGHCAEAPAIMINDQVYKELNADKIKKIFQNIRLTNKI